MFSEWRVSPGRREATVDKWAHPGLQGDTQSWTPDGRKRESTLRLLLSPHEKDPAGSQKP